MQSGAPITTVRGRGAHDNPKGRFERIAIEADEPGPDRIKTTYLRDASRSIIARNNSPDVPFDASVNPYRGCEHGCIYCYARPTHEFLGFSAGLDFETKILVKEDAPGLLRQALMSPRWQPQVLAMSGVTDPYQPIEKKLALTRGCLEVLTEFRNPVGMITKNALIARDADLLGELARHNAASVCLSITTLDPDLVRKMEPRTASPKRRLEAITRLRASSVPVGVLVAPVIPGLNDHEIPALLDAAASAGAQFAGFVPLRLPGAVEDLFVRWLERELPDRRDKVLNRLRSLRGGQLNDARFGQRMRGSGVFAQQVRDLFEIARKKAGLDTRGLALSTAAFRRPGDQMNLFATG